MAYAVGGQVAGDPLFKNLAVVMKLGGVSTQFYGAQGTYTAPTPYTGINCIKLLEGFDAISAQIPTYGGVAKPQGLTLVVVDRGGLIGQLISRTLEGSTSAALKTSLAAVNPGAPFTIFADEPIDAFDASGYISIGQETIKYSAKDNGLRTFTGVASERGALDSTIRRHLVDNLPHMSFKPLITQNPVHWRHRKVTVTLHDIDSQGVVNVVPYQTLLKGILTAEPKPVEGTSGMEWSFECTEDLAKFDTPIGAQKYVTTLLDGHVWSDNENCLSFNVREMAPAGSIFASTFRGYGHAAGGNPAVIVVDSVEAHADIWENGRGNFPGSFPAAGPLTVERYSQIRVTGWDGGNPRGVFELAEDLPAGALLLAAGFYTVTNGLIRRSFLHSKIALGAEFGLKTWPSDYLDHFNTYINTLGASGVGYYIDCILSPTGVLTVTTDIPYAEDNPPRLEIVREAEELENSIWYPMLRPEEPDFRRGFLAGSNADVVLAQSFQADDAPVGEQMSELPRSFWQTGMEYLLVKDDTLVDPAGGATQFIKVRYKDPFAEDSGKEQELILGYDALTSFDKAGRTPAVGDTLGYRLHITDAYRSNRASFGNWPSTGDCTIEQHNSFASESVTTILLKVMMSGSGTPGFPDATYSVLSDAYGLNIDPANIDVEAFEEYPIPPTLAALQFHQIKADTAKKVFDGLLKALGAAIVMKEKGNRKLISIVPVRTHDPLSPKITVTDNDWLVKARPGSGKLDDKVAIWRFRTDFNPKSGKFEREWNLHDNDTIDYLGGFAGKAQSIDIRGLSLEIPGSGVGVLSSQGRRKLIPIFKKLKDRFGTDARLLKGSINWNLGRIVNVGDTVKFTADNVRDIDGTKGITNAYGQVLAIKLDPISNEAKIVIYYSGRKFGGFAPVAQVSVVNSANKITLYDNKFTNPNGSLKDWETFLEADGTVPGGGVPIRCVHVGDESNNTNATFTANTVGLFTVVGHGLSVDDRIRGRDYDNSIPLLTDNYVHLSDAGLIGVGDIAAFVYS